MGFTDTFLDSLLHSIDELGGQATRSYIAVRTGHWQRISMAMHLRRQTEIGHPWADTCWDFLNLVDKCFPDAGIEAAVVLSEERITRARKTKASGDSQRIDVAYWRTEEDFMEVLRSCNNGLLTMPDGTFSPVDELDLGTLEPSKFFQLPLGPVLIRINGYREQESTPWNTFLYWGWTFERGEEPTEIEAPNGFSTVSGWKAYARWMQAYLLAPKKDSINDGIKLLPSLLRDRRESALPYFRELVETEELESLTEIYASFVDIIEKSLEHIETLDELYRGGAGHREIRQAVSQLYFEEQRSTPLYKQIKNLHHDLVRQRRAS